MELEEFSNLYGIVTEDFWGLGDAEGFECVEESAISCQDRWRTYWKATYKAHDGKFWTQTWVAGSTEYQDCDPDFEFFEVEPVEVTKIIYTAKK